MQINLRLLGQTRNILLKENYYNNIENLVKICCIFRKERPNVVNRKNYLQQKFKYRKLD